MTGTQCLTLIVLTLVVLGVGSIAVPFVAAAADRWQARRHGYSVQHVADRRRYLDRLEAEGYPLSADDKAVGR